MGYTQFSFVSPHDPARLTQYIRHSKSVAPFAEKFGGVTPGDCATQGFTVFDHTESISMGPLGSADVDIYKKASVQV